MSKNYNKLHPQQARAKWLVQTYVRRRKLIKPEHCQLCNGSFSSNKLQAHHYDYNEPLRVSWYCDACHKKVHQMVGKDWKTLTGSVTTQLISIQIGRMADDA